MSRTYCFEVREVIVRTARVRAGSAAAVVGALLLLVWWASVTLVGKIFVVPLVLIAIGFGAGR